ncbi:hypothetical protein DRP53_00340 [candidate division WOR-3 bacterium]|uniref:Uncharacterized protein n=1 Tax=candidate division WOR-3 bacterium TaxID=2052148 RepID=A0A660SLX9_UNCW3|nr:MAG: hypothetical protein DRP53_00340 [candidate division WOR-3 bacterium]
MSIFERLTKIDRRIIYFVLGLAILLPLLKPWGIPVNVMDRSRDLFTFIEDSTRGRAVMISFDYDPQVMPEVHPMAYALVHHLFALRRKVIGLCLNVQGTGMAVDVFNRIAAEYNERARSREDSIIYGRDYVFLGWKSGYVAVILGMGESIKGVYPKDYYGNPIDELEVMEGIKNYRQIGLCISLSGAAFPDTWVAYAGSRYGLRVGAGVTAVMGASYYPYLQTRQLVGMLAGLKGAAEYETLLDEHNIPIKKKTAAPGMDAQNLAHLVMIVFIVIGNIGYFYLRRR